MTQKLEIIELQNTSEPPSPPKISSHKHFPLDPTRLVYKAINVPEEELKTTKLGSTTEAAIEEIRKKLENLTTNPKGKEKENIPKINTLKHIEELE